MPITRGAPGSSSTSPSCTATTSASGVVRSLPFRSAYQRNRDGDDVDRGFEFGLETVTDAPALRG